MRSISIAIVAVSVTLLAQALSTAIANHLQREDWPRPQACMSKAAWSAPDRNRPCVIRVFEDGSVIVRQRDGDRWRPR